MSRTYRTPPIGNYFRKYDTEHIYFLNQCRWSYNYRTHAAPNPNSIFDEISPHQHFKQFKAWQCRDGVIKDKSIYRTGRLRKTLNRTSKAILKQELYRHLTQPDQDIVYSNYVSVNTWLWWYE